MPASTVTEPPPILVVRATFGRKRQGSATDWQGRTSCGGPLDGLTAAAPTFPRATAGLAGKIWDAIQAGAARTEDVHPDELSVLTVLAIQETLYRGTADTPALRVPADAARGRRGGWFLQVCDFAGPLGGIIGSGSTLARARAELVAVIRTEISAGRVRGLPRDYAAPVLVQHSQRRTYTAAVLSRLAAAA